MDFYVTKAGKTFLNDKDLQKFSFNGGFQEYLLSLAASIKATLHVPNCDLKITKIEWSENLQGPDGKNGAFRVDYEYKIHFDSNEIEQAFITFLEKNGGRLDSIFFENGAYGHITVNLTLPVAKRGLYNQENGDIRFREALRSTVRNLDFVIVYPNVKFE